MVNNMYRHWYLDKATNEVFFVVSSFATHTQALTVSSKFKFAKMEALSLASRSPTPELIGTKNAEVMAQFTHLKTEPTDLYYEV